MPDNPIEASPTGAIQRRVKKLLEPLLAELDTLVGEETEAKEKLELKRKERETIERVLRSAKLIEPKQKAAKGPPKAVAPKAPSPPRTKQGEEIEKDVLKAIASFEGEPFQIGMIERKFGISRGSIERVIGIMRGDDRLRLLGDRPQIDRSPDAPGGRPAMTFQEV